MSNVINGLSIFHFVLLRHRRSRLIGLFLLLFASTTWTGVSSAERLRCDFFKELSSLNRTVFDDLVVRLDSSVELVWDVVLVGVDDMDEVVSIVDVGEMTRRSSVSAG